MDEKHAFCVVCGAVCNSAHKCCSLSCEQMSMQDSISLPDYCGFGKWRSYDLEEVFQEITNGSRLSVL